MIALKCEAKFKMPKVGREVRSCENRKFRPYLITD